MTLTEFLLARISEDEAAFDRAVAHEVDDLRTRGGMPNTTAQDVRDYWLRPPGSTGDPVADTPTEWRRWLAECEAKRRIIEFYAAVEQRVHDEGQSPEGAEWTLGRRQGAWQAVRALALPYADHPDYDETWRP